MNPGSGDGLAAAFYLGMIAHRAGNTARRDELWQTIENAPGGNNMNGLNRNDWIAATRAARGDFSGAVKLASQVFFDVQYMQNLLIHGIEPDQKMVDKYTGIYIYVIRQTRGKHLIIPHIFRLARLNAQLAYWYDQSKHAQWKNEITRIYQRLGQGEICQSDDQGSLSQTELDYTGMMFPEVATVLNLRSYLAQ